MAESYPAPNWEAVRHVTQRKGPGYKGGLRELSVFRMNRDEMRFPHYLSLILIKSLREVPYPLSCITGVKNEVLGVHDWPKFSQRLRAESGYS